MLAWPAAYPPERVHRTEAYNHVFEVVALIPGPERGKPSAEIMRLRQAEQTAAADSRVIFLGPCASTGRDKADRQLQNRVRRRVAGSSSGVRYFL